MSSCFWSCHGWQHCSTWLGKLVSWYAQYIKILYSADRLNLPTDRQWLFCLVKRQTGQILVTLWTWSRTGLARWTFLSACACSHLQDRFPSLVMNHKHAESGSTADMIAFPDTPIRCVSHSSPGPAFRQCTNRVTSMQCDSRICLLAVAFLSSFGLTQMPTKQSNYEANKNAHKNGPRTWGRPRPTAKQYSQCRKQTTWRKSVWPRTNVQQPK